MEFISFSVPFSPLLPVSLFVREKYLGVNRKQTPTPLLQKFAMKKRDVYISVNR